MLKVKKKKKKKKKIIIKKLNCDEPNVDLIRFVVVVFSRL